MSISFFIKNKKKLFSYEKTLTVEQVCEISEDEITQFGIDESAEDFDVKKFYQSKVSDFTCLILGVYGESSRGFELSYDEENHFYHIRVYTPSSETDWKIVLRYMKALSKKFGSLIISEREETYSYEDIETFPYREDILYGLHVIFSEENEKIKNSIIHGISRPVVFNANMKETVLNSEDPVITFESIVKSLQYLDAYSANQRFYRNKEDNKVLGVYTLTQNLDTILPYEPYIEFEHMNLVKKEEISNWQLTLVVIDGDENDYNSYYVLGTLDYSDFIERLPKETYEFLDGTYILVHALNREQMEEMFRGQKVC